MCSLVHSFGSKYNKVFVGEIWGLCGHVLRVLPRIHLCVCVCEKERERERVLPRINLCLMVAIFSLNNHLPFITGAHARSSGGHCLNHFTVPLSALSKLNLSSPLVWYMEMRIIYCSGLLWCFWGFDSYCFWFVCTVTIALCDRRTLLIFGNKSFPHSFIYCNYQN